MFFLSSLASVCLRLRTISIARLTAETSIAAAVTMVLAAPERLRLTGRGGQYQPRERRRPWAAPASTRATVERGPGGLGNGGFAGLAADFSSPAFSPAFLFRLRIGFCFNFAYCQRLGFWTQPWVLLSLGFRFGLGFLSRRAWRCRLGDRRGAFGAAAAGTKDMSPTAAIGQRADAKSLRKS
jgi:hypothetical protein